jgi:N6-adenosine-specific RNA methylase IME4
VLYADPPWHFEVYNEESGVERAAGNHYSTMSLDEICALPVLSLASPDAVLFMWTTVPHLRESFDVLVAWGFEYKTNVVWVKDKIGLGYFARPLCELRHPGGPKKALKSWMSRKRRAECAAPIFGHC